MLKTKLITVASFDTGSKYGFGTVAKTGEEVFVHAEDEGMAVIRHGSMYLLRLRDMDKMLPEVQHSYTTSIPRVGDELVCTVVPSAQKGVQWQANQWAYVYFARLALEGIKSAVFRMRRIVRKKVDGIAKSETVWQGTDIFELSAHYPIVRESLPTYRRALMQEVSDHGLMIEHVFEKHDESTDTWIPCDDPRIKIERRESAQHALYFSKVSVEEIMS